MSGEISTEEVRRFIAVPEHIVLTGAPELSIDRGALVGAAVVDSEHRLWIKVHPDHQKRGIGSALLTKVVVDGLLVEVSTSELLFFEKRGFRCWGVSPNGKAHLAYKRTSQPSDGKLHIALLEPEIPPNTGNIGRLCLGVGATLHLIHPLGFSLGEKAVRRAGLDYWKHVEVVEHADLAAFLSWAKSTPIHMFSAKGARPFGTFTPDPGDILLFGKESGGLPAELRDSAFFLPLRGEVRSMNLANAASIALYAAMMQLRPSWFFDAP